jgi:hypothetical protein
VSRSYGETSTLHQIAGSAPYRRIIRGASGCRLSDERLVGLDEQIFVRQADITDLPFADTFDELRAAIESSGFAIERWNDLSDQAASMMQTLLTLPPNPLGLHAFVTDFAEKAKNLTAALADGRLRAIQGIAGATGSGVA